jgi:hypothetical protein
MKLSDVEQYLGRNDLSLGRDTWGLYHSRQGLHEVEAEACAASAARFHFGLEIYSLQPFLFRLFESPDGGIRWRIKHTMSDVEMTDMSVEDITNRIEELNGLGAEANVDEIDALRAELEVREGLSDEGTDDGDELAAQIAAAKAAKGKRVKKASKAKKASKVKAAVEGDDETGDGGDGAEADTQPDNDLPKKSGRGGRPGRRSSGEPLTVVTKKAIRTHMRSLRDAVEKDQKSATKVLTNGDVTFTVRGEVGANDGKEMEITYTVTGDNVEEVFTGGESLYKTYSFLYENFGLNDGE